jgi:hypothetical protein
MHLKSRYSSITIFNQLNTLAESVLIIIKIYGMIEVITGFIKLTCLAIIICALIAINRGGECRSILLWHPAFLDFTNRKLTWSLKSWAAKSLSARVQMYVKSSYGHYYPVLNEADWSSPTAFDSDAAENWFTALL